VGMSTKSKKKTQSVLAIKMPVKLRKRIKAAADSCEQTESQFSRLQLGKAADETLAGKEDAK